MKLNRFIIVVLLILSLFSLISIYAVTISGNVVMMNNVPFFQVKIVTIGSGSGVVVPPVVNPMPAGAVLKFKAIANPGSSFGGWSPPCVGPPEGDTCILPVQTDTVIIATFNSEVTNPLLAVIKTGQGSSIIVSGDGKIICPPNCEKTYSLGSQVRLNAVLAADSVVESWSGCDNVDKSKQICNLIMLPNINKKKIVTINLSKKTKGKTKTLSIS